jgi:hypothetical protein
VTHRDDLQYLIWGLFLLAAVAFACGGGVERASLCRAACGEHWTTTSAGCVCLEVAP